MLKRMCKAVFPAASELHHDRVVFEKQRVPRELLAKIQVDAFNEEVPDAVVQEVQGIVCIPPAKAHGLSDCVVLKGLPDINKVVQFLERGDVVLQQSLLVGQPFQEVDCLALAGGWSTNEQDHIKFFHSTSMWGDAPASSYENLPQKHGCRAARHCTKLRAKNKRREQLGTMAGCSASVLLGQVFI